MSDIPHIESVEAHKTRLEIAHKTLPELDMTPERAMELFGLTIEEILALQADAEAADKTASPEPVAHPMMMLSGHWYRNSVDS